MQQDTSLVRLSTSVIKVVLSIRVLPICISSMVFIWFAVISFLPAASVATDLLHCELYCLCFPFLYFFLLHELFCLLMVLIFATPCEHSFIYKYTWFRKWYRSSPSIHHPVFPFDVIYYTFSFCVLCMQSCWCIWTFYKVKGLFTS